ncbi:MAG: response regulator [Planctomycetota bacterium]|nr:response regulator [Planctomycetota bacterium]
MRVLFVDDESSVRDLIAIFCNILEIEYAIAANVEEALSALEKETFALVVTDLEMPDKNGAYLACEVRQRYPQTGVFAFSGTPFSAHHVHQGTYIFEKIFHKPQDYSRLMAEVMKYLALRKYPFLT